MIPTRQIRAWFDDESVVVYQAFNDAIADAALHAQHLVAPFSTTRMTWVKPSFLWMMERSAWATSANQQRVLAVHVARAHFERALAKSVRSGRGSHGAPVLIQWDPERNLHGAKLDHRSLQLGLGRQVCAEYASQWIVRIEDITPLVRRIQLARCAGDGAQARQLLPIERPYPLNEGLMIYLGLGGGKPA